MSKRQRTISSANSDESVVQLVHHVIGLGVEKSARRGPFNDECVKRPDLTKQRSDWRRKTPAANDASADDGTHDVNDEMLADCYRRGLRVWVGPRTGWRDMDWLFW